MFKFYKSRPNAFTILFQDGKAVKKGTGINFWYLSGISSIMSVSTLSTDTPFIFTEMTADYQELSVQGNLSYSVSDPQKLCSVLDMTIDTKTGAYTSEDPENLVNRVVLAVQANAREYIANLSLRHALSKVGQMANDVLVGVQNHKALKTMGIAVDGLGFTNVRAKPEMQKALEAEYRETLQREADQAIYARRVAAQAEEQKLENAEMANSVELENQRRKLVDTQARNIVVLAEADAKAEEMKLEPYANMPPQALMGLALKEWASNAGQIGNLSITPDILTGLVAKMTN